MYRDGSIELIDASFMDEDLNAVRGRSPPPEPTPKES